MHEEIIWADDSCYDFKDPVTYIVAAAMIVEGVLYAGMRHSHCIQAAYKRTGKPVLSESPDGFIDNHMNFLDRRESLKLAEKTGQLQRRTGPGDELYSEDLW